MLVLIVMMLLIIQNRIRELDAFHFPITMHRQRPAGTGCLRGQRTIAHLWNDKHGKGSSSLKCTVEPWSLAKYERKQGLTPPE